MCFITYLKTQKKKVCFDLRGVEEADSKAVITMGANQ